jgi:hypothetical protein
LIYPVQALAFYALATGSSKSLQAAERCAVRMVESLGPSGEWWWHYDVRTGHVVEQYPVYAVHQDAMAPMALMALDDASGSDHSEVIRCGLNWLEYAPQIKGSLVDEANDLIWRKVCRREPGKLTRRLQAAASGIHPRLRIPWTDTLFPPWRIDYECRPYHLGWILFAWNRWAHTNRNVSRAGHSVEMNTLNHASAC